MFPNVLINLVAGVATSALQTAARDPATPLAPADIPAVTQAVRETVVTDPRLQDIGKAVEEAATPVPWYADKVFVGSLVAVITGVVSIVWGYQLTPEHQAVLTNVLPPILGTVAAGVALVARTVSKVKPIASGPVK